LFHLCCCILEILCSTLYIVGDTHEASCVPRSACCCARLQGHLFAPLLRKAVGLTDVLHCLRCRK
jgi:hypothetical protein